MKHYLRDKKLNNPNFWALANVQRKYIATVHRSKSKIEKAVFVSINMYILKFILAV